ncbi:MAG: hypothetical protein NC041_00835 [Bacteroides sp.]|nr:hypothetical protein [Prevotella sp.]MCM1408023.1 hypothetical protein [Treponema brennaborense]MCM1468999.1 hypothetical protein [Bacteroides sp.]
MIISNDCIANLVPHKGKMLLLNRIVFFDTKEGLLVSESDISADWLFYDAALSGVPSWVSFELMAQSIAALNGIAEREKTARASACGSPPAFGTDAFCSAPDFLSRSDMIKPKTGFIVSISAMHFSVPVLTVGSAVRTEVLIECRDNNVCSFTGTVTQNGIEAGCGRLVAAEHESK